jgi:hypothetical protein
VKTDRNTYKVIISILLMHHLPLKYNNSFIVNWRLRRQTQPNMFLDNDPVLNPSAEVYFSLLLIYITVRGGPRGNACVGMPIIIHIRVIWSSHCTPNIIMAIWLDLKRIEPLSDQHSSYLSPILTKLNEPMLSWLFYARLQFVQSAWPLQSMSRPRKHASDSVSSHIPCRLPMA